MNKLLLQIGIVVFVCVIGFGMFHYVRSFFVQTYVYDPVATTTPIVKAAVVTPTIDKALYNQKMLLMANNPAPKPVATTTSTSTATTTISYESFIASLLANASASTSISIPGKLWPVSTAYPNYGAILPFKRIVAYYGNFYSKQMGVLGQYPEEQMLEKLKAEVANWQAADPETPVVPAIHYIVTTAQELPGKGGKYRLQMPDSQIQKAIDIAKKVDGLVFLDVQIGLSTLQEELPVLEHFLKLPNVHLGIDPEFSMKTGAKPGTVIGSFNAADINYTTQFLAKIVKEHNIPPKVLILHRFTRPMITGYKNITTPPEVQIVMDMDGWGPPAQKLQTYRDFIVTEPVQFTGFKLFYKNDLLPPSKAMLTPAQLMKLSPRPMYIQYQ